jgi:hypothetical protein
MEREEEIKIIIGRLEKNVLNSANFPGSLADTIIKNGKLIESYIIELEQIKKSKI